MLGFPLKSTLLKWVLHSPNRGDYRLPDDWSHRRSIFIRSKKTDYCELSFSSNTNTLLLLRSHSVVRPLTNSPTGWDTEWQSEQKGQNEEKISLVFPSRLDGCVATYITMGGSFYDIASEQRQHTTQMNLLLLLLSLLSRLYPIPHIAYGLQYSVMEIWSQCTMVYLLQSYFWLPLFDSLFIQEGCGNNRHL